MSADPQLPALLGGAPVRPQGPPDWPVADADVLSALQDAYRDGSWGKYHGGRVQELEARLAEYHQLEFALTCASGTFAVELALRALKVGPGDEVVLSAYDYPGNFFSIHAVGAKPVLVDVDSQGWWLDPGTLANALGPRVRAAVVSHLHGGMVAMREVLALCRERGVAVVEDAAQAPGAVVQGKRAGTWGDVGILSFGGSKLLTAGRGGAILTPHADVFQRAKTWLQRGNLVCPLSELQAAVLLPQLAKLDERNRHREQAVRRLAEGLREVSGVQPVAGRLPDTQPGYYKVGFQYRAEVFGLPRETLVAALRAEGVAIDEGFRALHVGRSPSRFRAARDLAGATRAQDGVLVLHHPVLLGGPAELDEVVRAFQKTFQHRRLLVGSVTG